MHGTGTDLNYQQREFRIIIWKSGHTGTPQHL